MTSDIRRDHSSYAEIGSGTDIPTGTLQSISTSPENGPTPIPSRPESPVTLLQEPPKRERGRVRFNSNSEISDSANRRSSLPLGGGLRSPLFEVFPKQGSQPHSRTSSAASLLRHNFDGTNETVESSPDRGGDSRGASPSPIRRPRPSVLRNNSFGSVYRGEAQVQGIKEQEIINEKTSSAIRAHERAQRVATAVGTHSSPASPNSVEEEAEDYFSPRHMHGGLPVRIDDIPLSEIDRQKYGVDGLNDVQDEKRASRYASEAKSLVRAHTTRNLPSKGLLVPVVSTPGASGRATPESEQAHYEDYVPPPDQYRGGVLTSLLKLYNTHNQTSGHSRRNSGADSTFGSQPTTPGSSGMTTPQRKKDKWYNQKNAMKSQDTLDGLIQASAILGQAASPATTPTRPNFRPPPPPRSVSEQIIDFASGKKRRNEEEYKITVHIAETLSRQRYILKICEALMSYGAPTHRLEEYMRMTSRVLEIDGSFLYIPGCMIVSFNDSASHTSQVKLVRASQGIDLGRLKDVHEIYKEVVHDCIDTDEALRRLEVIVKSQPLYGVWMLVVCYGLASVFVAPFAFEARLIDLPVCFLLGSILGVLQLIIAPASELYNNVFEISAAVLTSFLARAFGSIQGGNLFCFSALAQSAIVMILPGYMVLCGSLELQSRSIIAGSVRMFYAIMYSLFLGFGITVGTALYGIIDVNATSATTCSNTINPYYNFLFVPPFTLILGFINKAKIKQLPIMLIISFMGYVVNYFAAKKFPTSVEISGALGAFSVGIAGNLYSRLRHGLAAAALLPAIFVQVPSGLAASGSLLAGLSTADSITNSTSTMNGTVLNGTSQVSWIDPVLGVVNATFTNPGSITSLQNSSSVFTAGLGNAVGDGKKHFASLAWIAALVHSGWARDKHVKVTSTEDLNTIVFNVAYSMIQVAIGITVGLFMSALVIYPFGKRRSGLFSF